MKLISEGLLLLCNGVLIKVIYRQTLKGVFMKFYIIFKYLAICECEGYLLLELLVEEWCLFR